MTDMTLAGVAQAKAKSTLSSYKSLFGFLLLVEFIVSIAVLAIPDRILNWLGMEHIPGEKWLQLLAGTWIFLLLFQIIARREPLLGRYPNIVNIIGRVGLAGLLIYVGGDFLYIAAYMLVSALLLYIFFRRMIIDELQTRP